MFLKLRNRFLILNMLMISILMIIAFTIIYSITYKNVQKENTEKLLNQRPHLKIQDFSKFENNQTILLPPQPKEDDIKFLPFDYMMSFSIIIDENDGTIYPGNSRLDLNPEDYQLAGEKVLKDGKETGNVRFADKIWKYQKLIVNTSFNSFGTLSSYIFLDVTESYQTLHQLLITFIIVGLVMLVAIYFISLYFAKRAIEPISEAWIQQKQFIADASHELKTPLSTINANSDALLVNEDETIRNQKKWLLYIKQDITRMSKLINDLLYLSKLEKVDIKIQEVNFNFSEQVEEIIFSMEAFIFEKGLKLNYSIESDLYVKGDLHQIERVIIILLDNAIKYSSKNGLIEIELKASGRRKIYFTIKNTGKEIEKEDLIKIFNRFYRTDSSRSTETGGYGLGLSIAKEIIEHHQGKIFAKSQDNVNIFTINIDASKQEQKVLNA